ncbi:hypothetical protein GOB81_06960 [Acetobacter sp. LMG 1627]|uniref:Homogentisate 1,2-dioxygenase n=2 Tax=Acetobacter conturbans TaxID=1737472 RepID=A0ABX0K236_9PROT|nr:hypothetical protein [Acetobacter conturbans]
MAIFTLGVAIASVTQCFATGMDSMPGHEACLPGQVVLPEGLRGWSSPVEMRAATEVSGLESAVLTPGKAARVTLRRTAEITYALRPAEPGGKVSSGGMIAFDAPVAGTYRVMLNVRAWLDVVHDGKALDAVHHQHGPACSTIGKMVDFPLPAGRSVIQLSGSGKPVSEVMVVPVP